MSDANRPPQTVRAVSQGELQGIGFDDNLAISGDYWFQVYGTQHGWGRQDFNTYSGSGTRHYVIPVGEHFQGQMKYLTFGNDHDVVDPTARSVFSNARVYEAPIDFNQLPILSYGGARENVTDDWSVEDGGTSLRLSGNTWKAASFDYVVTPDTMLKFDYSSDNQGELQGIGFDDNLAISGDYWFQLYGTQHGWGRQDFNNTYSGSGTRHYVIPVGEHFQGVVKYLTFGNDHDVANPTAQSVFSNVRVYENAVDATFRDHVPIPFVGQLVDPVFLRGIEDVYLEGDYAFLPCREGKRLTIVSIKDPANLKVVSSFTHPDLGEATGLAINGNTLYLTSLRNRRLLVLDATDKSAVRLLGSVTIGEPETAGWVYKVAYRDGYCYVAHQTEKKLFVVDVRDPLQPVVVGSVVVTTENDGPFSVLLRDNYALVGTLFGNRARLAVVDVEDPAEPRLISHVLDPVITVVSGTMVGDLYFAASSFRNALLVFDVSDPANTKLEAKLVDDRLIAPNRCVVSGDRAYLPLGQGGDGVAVVDIADPRQPKFLTSFRDAVMKKAYGVAVRGDMLFIGARDGNSLVVLNRHDLEPVALHSARTGGA